ncbi:greglin isoform X3 [Schistocerca gregaria]|uniref:greglin isoform X1 n=1 Tax=Schistocerca gregaria TaxID=7010 RepID=UPI00211DB9CE|nr:greglin isoform X1 [Schistocerca gregaria]XP_049852499.1 greglin isoform X3 [Schistocerca gregaria]
MKVVLLLVVALVAVAHARYGPRESRYQPTEDSEQPSSAERRHSPGTVRRRSEDDGSASPESQEMSYTELPCPSICPLIYAPVCVEDSNQDFYLFVNECEVRKCGCEAGFVYTFVPREMCKATTSLCPMQTKSSRRLNLEEDTETEDSSSSE